MAKKNQNKKTLTPKLRFPEFEDGPGWEEVPLGAIAEIKLGKMLDGKKHTSGRLLPYLNNLSVRWNKVDTSDLPQMYFDEDELDNFGLRAGDVVVCEGGEPGRSAVWDGRMPELKFQKAIHRVRFTVPFEPRMLVSYLEAIAGTSTFESLFTGGGIKHLTRETFARLKVPKIPEAEQRKIAACLTSLDELIAAEGRKLEGLRAHKKGLMQQLFPREGETRPRLRFPEFRKAGKWKPCRIADLLEKVAQPIRVEADAAYREIGVRSHGKGIFHKDAVKGSAIGTKRVFRVVENAFVVNIIFAWEQAVAYTTKNEAGMIASHRFPMYLPKLNRCDVRFLKLAFLTPTGKHLLGLASPGGAGRNRTLGQKEFDNTTILVPETQEQTSIADAVLTADAVIAAQSRKLEGLRDHKKGLMQRLFPSPEGD